MKHSALPVQTLDNESFSRVLSLQFLHHIVQLTVQLQHKHTKPLATQIPHLKKSFKDAE